MTTAPGRVAVLGLGEAGAAIAEDLGALTRVNGYDPARRASTGAYALASSAAEAADGADIVLALTAAPDAADALSSILTTARDGAIYADLSSSSPALKRRLAQTAAEAGLRFVDAVFLAPVPPKRSATPMQASGAAAAEFASVMGALGMDVTALGGEPGEASARKLLRSIIMKGLPALLIEALRAAENEGVLEWYSEHIRQTITGITPELLTRLLGGTLTHSARRIHEMTAAVELIEAGGGTAAMTRATVEVLRSVEREGIPRGEALR